MLNFKLNLKLDALLRKANYPEPAKPIVILVPSKLEWENVRESVYAEL